MQTVPILHTDNRTLKRVTMAKFFSCRFVDDCRSIVLQGYTSLEKTFLVCFGEGDLSTATQGL